MGDTGQQTTCFDSCQLITTWMCNIRLQTPKLARNCEIKNGMPVVRTVGHSNSVRSRDYKIFMQKLSHL